MTTNIFLFAFITLIFGTNNVMGDTTNVDPVNVLVYYESLCPLSQQVYSKNLVPVAKNLSDYIALKTNPYGFAQTFTDEHGNITFECQHGPEECYGNKIQACALNYLNSSTVAVEFNGCMIERGLKHSDDSVKECASQVGINADPIIKCIASDEGNKLLKQYGDEVSQLELPYLPAVFINGKVPEEDPYGRHLYDTICKAFYKKPAICD